MKYKKRIVSLVIALGGFFLLISNLSYSPGDWNDPHSYDESKSIEANLKEKLKVFLKNESSYFVKDAPLKSYRVVDIEYASMFFYKVELKLNFRTGVDSVGPFLKGHSIYYIHVEKYIDTLHTGEILTEEQYIKSNEEWDTSDVNVSYNATNRIEKRFNNGSLELSIDEGLRWVDTGLSLEEDNLISIYIQGPYVGVLYQSGEYTRFYHSDNFGLTSKNYEFVIHDDNNWSISSFNQAILSMDPDKTVFIASIDAALGSVHNVLIHHNSDGSEFVLINSLRSSKPYSESNKINNTIFFQDQSGEVYVSKDLGYSFERMLVPEHEDDVWDFPFNDIFTDLEVPRIEDGHLVVYANQGPNGDVKVNSKAKFISIDDGLTWKFDSYVLFKEQVID